MTDPSQYFRGRTVQEQMNEVIGYVDVRSAEVATDAIASDVAQVHQDMLDADADATAAAASAAAAAGTLANAVKKTGEASQSIAGDIAVAGTLSGGVVTGTQVTVPTPVNNTDAATKKYVDDQDASLKTYVDNQDATKISITDINSYAVGLSDNQDAYGNKTWHGHNVNQVAGFDMPSQTNRVAGDGWVKMYESAASNHPVGIFVVLPRRENASPGFGIIACGGHHIGTVSCKWLSKDYIVASYQASLMVTVEQDLITIWAKNISTTDCVLMRDIGTGYNGTTPTGAEGFTPSTDKTIYTMTEEDGQIVGYTDSNAVDHTFITYEISS